MNAAREDHYLLSEAAVVTNEVAHGPACKAIALRALLVPSIEVGFRNESCAGGCCCLLLLLLPLPLLLLLLLPLQISASSALCCVRHA
jgi:hypothetical protein